jgi:ankyrin repeat protein
VLSLFLRKNSEEIKSLGGGWLPIHHAADNSSLNVIKFLLKLYPESLTILTRITFNGDRAGSTLLHRACENKSNIADAKAIVEYLCKLCPALVHMKRSQGITPLHEAIYIEGELNMEVLKILCITDASAVRDKCTPTAVTLSYSQQLPLHLLISYNPPKMEVSDEGDCFRLFLQLYPASAGDKDGHLKTPYDLAVSQGLSLYFIRLLLNSDPSIDPVKRHDLNYIAARREGLFLAFRALSTTHEPTIWAKLRNEHRESLNQVLSYL